MAADEYGNVTSTSLKRYLINRMKDYLPDNDRKSRIVSMEPDFGFDDKLLFAPASDLESKTLSVDWSA